MRTGMLAARIKSHKMLKKISTWVADYNADKVKHIKILTDLLNSFKQEQDKLSRLITSDNADDIKDQTILLIHISHQIDMAIQSAEEKISKRNVTELLNKHNFWKPELFSCVDNRLNELKKNQNLLYKEFPARLEKDAKAFKYIELAAQETQKNNLQLKYENESLRNQLKIKEKQLNDEITTRNDRLASQLKVESSFTENAKILQNQTYQLQKEIAILKENKKNSIVKKLKLLIDTTHLLKKEIKEGSGARIKNLFHLIKTLEEKKDILAISSDLQPDSIFLSPDELKEIQNNLQMIDTILNQANQRYQRLVNCLLQPAYPLNENFGGNVILTDADDYLQDAYNGKETEVRKKVGGFSLTEKLTLSKEAAQKKIELRNFSKQDSNGRTAFMLALSKGHYKIAEYLIRRSHKTQKPECKLKLNHQDKQGQTALTLAARKNQCKSIEFCLSLNTKEKRKAWMLDAIEAWKSNSKANLNPIYEKHHMIDITSEDKEGMTAFMRAISCQYFNEDFYIDALSFFANAIFQHNHAMDEMIEKTQHPDIPSEQAEEIKHGALSHKINLFKTDIYGRTAFHLVCANKSKDAVLMMLEFFRQCHSNAHYHVLTLTDKNGYTPLMTASASGSKETVIELLKTYSQLKLDPNQNDNEAGFTALDWSIHNRKLKNKLMKEKMLEGKKADVFLELAILNHTDLELALRNAGVTSTIENSVKPSGNKRGYLSFINPTSDIAPSPYVASSSQSMLFKNIDSKNSLHPIPPPQNGGKGVSSSRPL